MTPMRRLTRREAILLALLALVALPLGLSSGVALPMQEARDRAIGTLAAAQADYVWVAAQAQTFAALAAAPAPPAERAAGIAGVEAALIESGLRAAVTALEAAPDGEIRLQLDRVAFGTFGHFLDGITRTSGYDLMALTIAPVDDEGRISASVGLVPRGG